MCRKSHVPSLKCKRVSMLLNWPAKARYVVYFLRIQCLYIKLKREELENINFSCQKKAYGKIFVHHLQELVNRQLS